MSPASSPPTTLVAPSVVTRIGVVTTGDQRGRLLGVPTANVVLTSDDPIDDGVYAGWLTACDGVRRLSAISVGRRPTFLTDRSRLLEAHVLDFTGDLYGQSVTVDLVTWIRGQRQFGAVEALIEQLQQDIAETRDLAARQLLSATSEPRGI